MQAGTCPNCGSAVQPGAEFCTVCGTRLAGLGAASGYDWSGATVPPPPPPPVNLPPGQTTAPTQPLPPAGGYAPQPTSQWPPPATSPQVSSWAATSPAYTPYPATTTRSSARPVAVLGAIAAAAGAFLPWIRFDFHFTAFKIPLTFLFQGNSSSGGLNAGIVLVVVAGLGLVMSFFPAVSVARRFLGLVALAVPVAFVAQLLRFDQVTLSSLFSHLGAGAYAAAAGGLLLAVG